MYSMPPQSPRFLASVPDASPTGTIKLIWGNLRKNNPELPETFTINCGHKQQLIESGIPLIDAAYAGIFSADADLALKLTGHNQSGLMFSYFDPRGKLYRWDDSSENVPFFRMRTDNGKAKYLSPSSSPTFIYVPRVANHSWVNSDGAFKTQLDLTATEGEKKALGATLNGIPCLGLAGVNSYNTGSKEAETLERLGFFISELDLTKQRSLTICFDSDVIKKPDDPFKENVSVGLAIKSFVYAIAEAYKQRELQAGAGVINKTIRLNDILKYSLLPVIPDEKVGLDDAIVKWGADAVKELLSNAMPLVEINRAQNEPKDIVTKVLFCTEPRGDKAPEKKDVHLQNHNRSLITWLYFNNRVMSVPGMGYFHYVDDSGVWREISEKQWGSLPEKVADAQGWRNRTSALQKQGLKLIENRLAVDPSQLNDSRYLAFLNGVLDLKEKTLHPHAPKYRMTRRLGFDYNPVANCPMFLEWLFFIFAERLEDGSYDSDSELCANTIEFVRALLRFALTPKAYNEPYPVEVIIYILGRPKKGKGTFMEIIQGLAGEAHTSWDLQSIATETGRYSLVGKLIATCTELKGSASADAITGMNQAATNEALRVRGLYENATTMRLNTVLVAAGNDPITSSNGDRAGLERRMAYLKVDRDIGKPDPKFKDKLKQELPGIYNWIMQISFDDAVSKIIEYRGGKQNSDVQKEMLDGQSSVYAWMIDPDDSDINLYCIPGEKVPSRIAYGRYKSWCSVYSYTPLNSRNWKKEMVKGGAEIIESNFTYFVAPEKDKVNVSNMLGL